MCEAVGIPPKTNHAGRKTLVQKLQENGAVYKSGTGTGGRGHRDAGVGTWDLGTWDEGLEDIKYGTWGRTCETGTRGRQIQGCGMWIIIANNNYHFSRKYVLVKPDLLRVPPCLFTKQRLGEDLLHWRKWNRYPGLLADWTLEPKAGWSGLRLPKIM